MNNLFCGQLFQVIQANQNCQMPYIFFWPSSTGNFDLNMTNLQNNFFQEKNLIPTHTQRSGNTLQAKKTQKPIKEKKAIKKKTIQEKAVLGKKRFQQKQHQQVLNNQKKKRKVSQNVFRNIQTNIVHQIFCFIQKRKRSGQIVKDQIDYQTKIEKLSLNIEKFYLYQRLIKQKTNNYVNMKSLKLLNKFHQPQCQIYSQEQQLAFLKMNRILIKHFLDHQFTNIALTSSRMKPESRLLHFQVKRRILQQLVHTLSSH